MAVTLKFTLDTPRLEKELMGKIKSQSELASEKIALLVVFFAKRNLSKSRGGAARLGLSRKIRGNAKSAPQYSHVATGKTLRSIRAVKSGNSWKVRTGGAAYELQWGIGPTTVPLSVLRSWATTKFPGMDAKQMDRFVKLIQRRIKRNGLRPTFFFTDAAQTVRIEVRAIRSVDQLPSLAALRSAISKLNSQAKQR